MAKLRELTSRPAVWTYVVGPIPFAYALLLALTVGLRIEQVAVLVLMAVLNYVPRLRPAFKALLPFFLFIIVYDGLRFVMPTMHELVRPHVAWPYHVEVFLFGVHAHGHLLTPPEALAGYHNVPLLLACGFAYFFFIYEVFLFGLYLLVSDRDLLRRFGWAFFGLAMMGFLTWCLVPAAPPWYVVQHGLGPADIHAPSNAARLIEVDAILGINFFEAFYSRATNVFGALPSLHAAFPLLVWLYVRKSRLAHLQGLCLGFFALMCFAAVYLGHHYVIDVALGAFYAVSAYWGAEELLYRRWPHAREQASGLEVGAV